MYELQKIKQKYFFDKKRSLIWLASGRNEQKAGLYPVRLIMPGRFNCVLTTHNP